MKGFLQRLSTKSLAPETCPRSSFLKGNRFFRRSKDLGKVLAPAPVDESSAASTKSRKRDRRWHFLPHRRDHKFHDAVLSLLPALLATENEETQSSDDTEDCDDVYLVDYHSDSESDDEACLRPILIALPVSIPETYQRQDRLGGVIVGGTRVLFTYAGFKRRQMTLCKLQSVPEGKERTHGL